MNNDLIKRIDERIDFWKEGEPSTSPIVQLLRDCRAEIELLSQSNECLRNQNTALDEILAEYSEREYVPMTADERWKIFMFGESKQINETLAEFEAAVIKRAGLEIKHD